jgi:hypothetical protein
VQTVLDGKWRSLDGRPMHAATVALSELHEAVFADHLTRAFGVEWEARDMGRDRNPAWAIAGAGGAGQGVLVPSRHIDAEKNRLIAEYVESTAGSRRGDDHQAPRPGHPHHPAGEAGPVARRPHRRGGNGRAVLGRMRPRGRAA